MKSAWMLVVILCVGVSCSREEPPVMEPAASAGQAKEAQASSENANPALVRLLGNTLLNARGETSGVGTLEGKIIGLYFSAHWCPPCRYFTPKLIEFYEEMRKLNKPFEVVLISSDRSEKDMFVYMEETGMPWKALPFSSPRRQTLGMEYRVQGIPTLIILNDQGQTLSSEGDSDIMQLQAGAYESWL